ncbi:hypothetical protein A2U01_0011825, partial [Trifolium medium]|nr:hypothetical protein [Trifolium medium]
FSTVNVNMVVNANFIRFRRRRQHRTMELTLEQDNALPTSFDLATVATALAAEEVAVVE